MNRLTRKQAAVVGAHTGVLCGPVSDLIEYVHSLPGLSDLTLSDIANARRADVEYHSKPDFMAMNSTFKQGKDE
jgi:hypothetical protein